jgi:hypothetical protein
MKSRPILFSGEMVRAILDGRKTQTRRVITVHWHKGKRCLPYEPWYIDTDGVLMVQDEYGDYHNYEQVMPCPFGQPGDELWVRETFYIDDCRYEKGPLPNGIDDMRDLYYRADGECCEQIPECMCAEVGKTPWRPSIHMPRWASRITLRVTSVRVERLHDISAADCLAEGIGKPTQTRGCASWDSR